MEELWISKVLSSRTIDLNSTVILVFFINIDNSALIGGVIKATSSIVKLTDSLFEYNIGYYGGVI